MSTVKFRAVGDNLLHSHVYNSCKGKDGSFNFDSFYEPIKELIQDADLAAVNQETIFVGDPKKYSSFPFFGTPSAAGDALIKAGFRIVTSATNHTMDKGRAGLKYTLDYWARHPEITLLGIHKTKKDAKKIKLVEKNGIKFAMFNYTRCLNYHPRPLGASYMVDLLKPRYKNKIRRELKRARKISDIVVVFVHWGVEYVHKPCKAQKMWARLFAECGVDLVIGTHPHVIQPLVRMKRPDGGKMAVFYSLGNFLSGQRNASRLLGGLADVTIIKKNGQAFLKDCRLVPIVTHIGPDFSSFGVYPLEAYPDSLGLKNHVGKTTGFDTRSCNMYDLFNKILKGEIEGKPHSKLDNLKAVIKHLRREKNDTF